MRDANIRDRLVAAGHRLFQLRGNLDLSGPEIIRAARVKSPASINQTFGTIDGLLVAVLGAEIERYRRSDLVMLTEASTTSLLGRIKNFISCSTTGATAGQVAAGFLFANVAGSIGPDKVALRKATQDVMVEIETTLVDAIKAARQAHQVTGAVDPRRAAAHIFAGIQKVRLDARLSGAPSSFPQFVVDCGVMLGHPVW